MRFIFVITVLFLHGEGGGESGVCVRICLCMNWRGGGKWTESMCVRRYVRNSIQWRLSIIARIYIVM